MKQPATIVIKTDAECMLRAAMGSVCIEHQHGWVKPHVLFREPLCHAGPASGDFEAQVVMLLFLLRWTLDQLDAGGFEPKKFRLRIETGSKTLVAKLKSTESSANRISGLLRECRDGMGKFMSIAY